jgi:hypothetical protein
MTMRKNAVRKKSPRITKSTPFIYVWKSGRFVKTYMYGQGATTTINNQYYN